MTLGISIVIENLLLAGFQSDTRSIPTDISFQVVELGPLLLSKARLYGFVGAVVVTVLLWALLAHSDTGKAIRAVAREKLGASLVGIDVKHIFAITFGLGTATLAVAACLFDAVLLCQPACRRRLRAGGLHHRRAGGMGSIPGALMGGLIVGVVESLSGLYLGESLGQIGIFLIFILVLLFRPTGLFGARA
ncbi:MAG: branched-chain amino acid ABC transporter permease [Roseovarius sp.]|nr:branched-chain amino acid ABC transporter permease [Roseovarius sp.]